MRPGSQLRPLAKTIVKGGLRLYDTVKATVEDAGNIVAEAKYELHSSTTGSKRNLQHVKKERLKQTKRKSGSRVRIQRTE